MSGVKSVSGLLSATPGIRMVDGGDILTLASTCANGAGNLKALAGGGAAGATQVNGPINEFTTVVTANDSAILPPAIAGLRVTVVNSGAANLRLYCQLVNGGNNGAADAIVPLAGGATVGYVTVAPNGFAELICPVVGRWKSLQQ